MSDVACPFAQLRNELDSRESLPFNLVTDRVTRKRRRRTTYSATGVSLVVVAVGSVVGVALTSNDGTARQPSPAAAAGGSTAPASCQQLASPSLLTGAIADFYPAGSVVATKIFPTVIESGETGIPNGMTAGPGSQIDISPAVSKSALDDWHLKVSINRLVPEQGGIGSFAQFGSIPGLPETASGSLAGGAQFEVAYKSNVDFGGGVSKPLGQAFVLGLNNTYRIDIYAAGGTSSGSPNFDSAQLEAMANSLTKAVVAISPGETGSLAQLDCS